MTDTGQNTLKEDAEFYETERGNLQGTENHLAVDALDPPIERTNKDEKLTNFKSKYNENEYSSLRKLDPKDIVHVEPSAKDEGIYPPLPVTEKLEFESKNCPTEEDYHHDERIAIPQLKPNGEDREKVSVALEANADLESPNLIDNYETETQQESPEKIEQRNLLTYSADTNDVDDEGKSLGKIAPRNPSYKEHREKSLDNSYNTLHYKNLSRTCKEYFKFLNRYHVADTLSVFGRTKVQLELRKLGIDSITIGLFGEPGAGKSALFNSVYYVMSGAYTEYSAERKTESETAYIQSVTDRRLELKVTEAITLLDNRGLVVGKSMLNEISKQCDGLRESGEFVPEGWNCNLRQSVKDWLSRCNKKQLFRNRVNCPIIVYSLMENFDIKSTKQLVKILKQTCHCSPIIVLTHSGEAKKEDAEIITRRTRVFEDLNCARVFAIDNYTFSDHERRLHTDEQIIEMLFNCCLNSDQAIPQTMANIEKGFCC